MRLALELADAGLLALPEEGEAAAPSPGLAIVEGETIIIGRKAAARARLTPRRLHNRFWFEISTEALGRPFGRRLRSADLAWTHLSELWHEVGRGVSSVILTLSGGRSEAQLGLILGVARSAGLPVDGLVDSAVAASVGQTADGPFLHLDLELHRTVLTVLSPGPRLQEVLVSDRVGLAGLHESWMRLVAGLFLKTTRFDPFHSAASEQDLYDRLPSILDQLCRRRSTTISLAANENVFSINLERDRVAAAAGYAAIDDLVRSAMAHRPATLLLSARAARAPGLADQLADSTGLEVLELPLAAATGGAHTHARHIVAPGTDLPFVTDLGGSATRPVEAVSKSPSANSRPPTHLLVNGVAHPIGGEPLWLGSAPGAGERGVVVGDGVGDGSIRDRHCIIRLTEGRIFAEDLSGGGCWINGEAMGRETALEAGDRLRLGTPGVEVALVAVEP